MNEPKKIYLCDPLKNTKCRKSGCYRSTTMFPTCCCTTHVEFARLNDKGEPIVYFTIPRDKKKEVKVILR